MTGPDPTDTTGPEPRPTGRSRRGFLAGAGLVGGGAVAGVVGGGALGRYAFPDAGAAAAADTAGGLTAAATAPVGFPGAHQAGIVDRAPAHLRFTAFDLQPTTSSSAARAALQRALQQLSGVGAQVAAGRWTSSQDDAATGLRPAHVTTTVGLGATGLAAAGLPVPAPLTPLPSFNNDQLDPARSGGDLGVQVCAEDAQLAASVTRALTVSCADVVRPRWQQVGFLPGVAATEDVGATRRNLMGQFDGTGNPASGADRDAAVWVPDGGEDAWMTGGTYLVCRRIRMMLDAWSRLSTSAQEQVIGRTRGNGAPLGRTSETDEMDFALRGPDGRVVVAQNAHVRLTHPDFNAGRTMLRRAYSFDEGFDADGDADAGLFFQAFQTDPRTVFVPIQLKLAALDALTAFIRHEASAVFAVPPGAAAGDYVGRALFQS